MNDNIQCTTYAEVQERRPDWSVQRAHDYLVLLQYLPTLTRASFKADALIARAEGWQLVLNDPATGFAQGIPPGEEHMKQVTMWTTAFDVARTLLPDYWWLELHSTCGHTAEGAPHWRCRIGSCGSAVHITAEANYVGAPLTILDPAVAVVRAWYNVPLALQVPGKGP